MSKVRKWVGCPALRGLLWLAADALACFSPPALALDKLTWAVLDFPPFQVLYAPYAGTGSFDGLLETLIRHLPEYDHEPVPMTFARRELELREGRKLCTPGIFRTPAREKLLVFSLPALIHLDNRLVHRTAGAHRFGDGPAVDLDAMFQRPDLVAGIFSGRSYAPNIDRLIDRYRNAPTIVTRAIRPEQMFEMLLAGEIDYTVLFPHEAAYLARRFNRPDQIAIRPIAGTPPYIVTHVACTRGPWGERMIQRIDAILKQQRETPSYRALSERWYVEADRALIRAYYPQMLMPGPAEAK